MMRRPVHTAGTDLERSYHEQGIVTIAGVDEAGRGPLAGPVVAAAVIFDQGVVIEGVNDSKQVSAERRETLAPLIRARARAVGLAVVSHEDIDRLNILRATHLAMERAVLALAVRPDLLLIDGNSYRSDAIPYVTVIDGDALSHSIAAASIIAKVERDNMMKEYDLQFPQYGFAAHKGYGTEQHRKALLQFGPSPIHRRSFTIRSDRR